MNCKFILKVEPAVGISCLIICEKWENSKIPPSFVTWATGRILPFTEMKMTLNGGGLRQRREDQNLGLGHILSCFRHLNVDFRGKVCPGDTNKSSVLCQGVMCILRHAFNIEPGGWPLCLILLFLFVLSLKVRKRWEHGDFLDLSRTFNIHIALQYN